MERSGMTIPFYIFFCFIHIGIHIYLFNHQQPTKDKCTHVKIIDMAHLHFPIPRFFASTQTETPEIIEHINILSLLRKRYKKTWNLPMINKTRRYTEGSKVRRTKYFALQKKKQNLIYIDLSQENFTIQVQLLAESFSKEGAEIFCFFIDICLPAAAFLDCHGTLIFLHTIGLE